MDEWWHYKTTLFIIAKSNAIPLQNKCLRLKAMQCIINIYFKITYLKNCCSQMRLTDITTLFVVCEKALSRLLVVVSYAHVCLGGKNGSKK